jgi:RloB-like protein
MPKSTKAKKVSDVKQEKAWLKKSEPSKYAKYTVSTNKTILIVCEGQTEELYFKSFPVYGLTVETLNLKGQSKLILVEKTKSFVKRSGNKYDEIWCVFDMDKTRGEQEFADFDNAITKAKSHHYEVAYSNDAFELWFYLHFNYSDQNNLRHFYYKELGKIWNINYEDEGKKYKFCSEIYDLLKTEKASQADAIQRAEKLYLLQKDLIYHKQNPFTMVFRLVKLLNENLRN